MKAIVGRVDVPGGFMPAAGVSPALVSCPSCGNIVTLQSSVFAVEAEKVSVSPSIRLTECGWHGWLQNGVWNTCADSKCKGATVDNPIPGPLDSQIPENAAPPAEPPAPPAPPAEPPAPPAPPASSYADLQASVEGKTPPVETQPKTADAVPPSLTHHAACGVVGETGAHGDLGSNAIDYVGPHRPETMPKQR